MAVTRIEEGGLGTDSFNLPVTLNGTDGSSTHAGDNIILDASASGVDAGERLLYEGIPPDSIDISNSISVLSGATLTVASGATIVNSGTATGFGSNTPTSADGQALGSTSAEWSDLYLADGGVIYFGNDRDITMAHVADTGITITNSVADANAGPVLNLYRNSASPADNDLLGEIQFKGENSNDDILEYASIVATSYDVTDGEEDGAINVDVMVAGTKTDAIRFGPVAGTASIVQTLHSASSTAAAPNVTFIGDNNTGMYRVGSDAVGFTTGGTKRMEINSTDVEISTGNILFETAGKGIYLGVTAATAANHLDDYEEGSWTPVLTGTGGVSGTQVYNNQTAKYIKVGNVVHCNCNIGITNKQTISGSLIVTGLPFTGAASSGNWDAGISFGYIDGFDLSAGHMMIGRVRADQPDIPLQEIEWQDDASAWLTESQLVVTAYLYITFTYSLL